MPFTIFLYPPDLPLVLTLRPSTVLVSTLSHEPAPLREQKNDGLRQVHRRKLLGGGQGPLVGGI